MKPGQNRPFRFGTDDKRVYIVQDSEVALNALNNIYGDPVYVGRAKTVVADSDDKWQLRKITYDSNRGITKVEWAETDNSIASPDFEFIWTNNSKLTISGITQANPAVVTVSDIGNLADGDKIAIQDVAGMIQVNFDGTNEYTVANISGNTFELSGIDASAFTAYISGGTVDYGEYLQYTYS